MDGFPGSDHLRDKDRARLHRIAEKLHAVHREKAESTTLEDLQALLPDPSDALREQALWRLIAEDLELRWQRGDLTLLEVYFEQFAEIAERQDIPVDLIFQEYLVRTRRGESPSTEEYAQRFPQQFPEFEERLHDFRWQGTMIPPPPRGGDTRATMNFSDHSTRGEMPAVSAGADRAGLQTVGDGRYALHRLLGTGMFGEVWLAEAPGGIEVAVKIIRFPLGHHMTHQEQRALQVMKTMKHPFLIQVQSYWEEDDRLVIVMDLAEKTLADRLEECLEASQPGIPREELLEYMHAAAEALDYLHSRDVIHRDIKPGNLLLTENFAKVGDFGIARVLERHDVSVRATVAGTPLYIAPEMFDGKPCPASDQYSLAVTYTELRTGTPPLAGESVLELMKAHATRKPELAGLTEEERPVVHRGLAKKPAERFPSCTAFAEALRDAQPAVRPAWPRRYALLLAAAGLAVIAAIMWRSLFPATQVLVPEGCEPALGAQLITCYDVMNRQLYDEVDLLFHGTRIPLRLIPSNPDHEHDPPTFYVMKNKVSNQLFDQLMPDQPAAEDCMLPFAKLPEYPVYCVTARQAHTFAEQLGGQLPTPAQWDKAAGEFDPLPGAKGPYAPSWDAEDRDAVAIGRGDAGPLAVGQATADKSPFGVNDMAGNGFEWTSAVYWNNENHLLADIVSQLGNDDWASVTVRGRGYASPRPYEYDAEKEIPPQYFVQDPETSFRVVIPVISSTKPSTAM